MRPTATTGGAASSPRPRATCSSAASACSTTPRCSWRSSSTLLPGRAPRPPCRSSTSSGARTARRRPTGSWACSIAKPANRRWRRRDCAGPSSSRATAPSPWRKPSRCASSAALPADRPQPGLLRSLDHAHRLFRRLEANLDVVDVAVPRIAPRGDLPRRGAELGPVDRIGRPLHLRPLRAGGELCRVGGAGPWAGCPRTDDDPGGRVPPRRGQGSRAP